METREDLYTSLTSWVRERPFAGLGIAFGIGYLLGGGLWSRTSARILGIGARYGLEALARNLITHPH